VTDEGRAVFQLTTDESRAVFRRQQLTRRTSSSVVCDDERRRVFGLHFCHLPFAFCLLPSQLGCGGFEVARTNATAARVCVAARGYEKTRKLNDARGARAGTDVATVGGRVSKEVLPRGDAR